MDTKTRILQAAVSLFGRHGLKGASIRDICSVADANIAAVNYYFGGKEALYAQVIRSVCEGTFELSSVPKGAPTDSAETRLCAWIEWYLRRHDDPRYVEFMSFVRREIADPTPMLKEIVDTVVDPVFVELRSLITELLPDGTSNEVINFHCGVVNGPALARTLMEPMRQYIDVFQESSLDIDTLIENTQRTVMASLRAYGAEISGRWETVC
jgi:AcrR family transcriptional regulator